MHALTHTIDLAVMEKACLCATTRYAILQSHS